MRAERAHESGTSYRLLNDDGGLVRSLTFRDVLALIAVREGKARARWRHRYSCGYRDSFIHPECDLYGIGFGTLQGLQRDDWTWTPLITRPVDEGPIALTRFGEQCLTAILALPGVTAEAVAA